MKALTTLTAVAALVAGISIASAQQYPAGPTPQGASPSATDRSSDDSAPAAGQSGAQSKPATNQTANKKGMKVTGKSRFCMTGAAGSDPLDCKFASLQACQTAAKPLDRTCQRNPNMAATTGSSTKK